MSPLEPNRNYALLYYGLSKRLQLGLAEYSDELRLFEGWRHPFRQEMLLSQSKANPHCKVTNAGAWQSWHQFGLAADLALHTLDSKWSWDFDTKKVRGIMLDQGLEIGPIDDYCHFQLTGGLSLDEARQLNTKYGTLAVWDELSRRLIAKGALS